MLQAQVLRIRAADGAAFTALLSRLGLLTARGALSPTVLAEGYSTVEPAGFVRELRRRLAPARRVLAPLRGERTPPAAWEAFLAYARREPRLVLARYLFTPREVAERILGLLRSSRGVEHPFTSGREVVRRETARFVASLPPYEAAILAHLAAGDAIRWVADATPAEPGGLVEAPPGTVVVVARPPGSDWELEWKRCGRRGDQPLDVVFRRRGRDLPPSHRFDAGSMGTSLQWEAIASSTLARLHRAVHGAAPPISRLVAMSSIRAVPAAAAAAEAGGERDLLDYLTEPRCFGRGFPRMRRAMAESVAAFEDEGSERLEGVESELGLTVRFLHRIAPAQALFLGTSSLRLDRAARYLSRPASCGLADEILETVLGEYAPPRGDSRDTADPARYAAAALAANRARADRVYLGLMRQIGAFWGVLAGVKGYSLGESFVARNVGLRGVWRGGRREVAIVFMDHDNLHVGGRRADDFHPLEASRGMATDERYILGNWRSPSGVRGEAEVLDAIYRVGRPLVRAGRAALLAAAAAACRRTRRKLGGPALRGLFGASFVRRVHDWDALLAAFVRRFPVEEPAGACLREWTADFLAARRHPAHFVAECAAALAEHGDFFRHYAFLYS
jgi:hypothetical protein